MDTLSNNLMCAPWLRGFLQLQLCYLLATSPLLKSKRIAKFYLIFFSSFDHAHTLINKSKFKITESLDTRSSSWIRGIKYLSCDGKTGYLLVKTDKKEYIHSNVPLELGELFRNAESYGAFYNQYIKYKYPLEIR